jgi:hypothetical protein
VSSYGCCRASARGAVRYAAVATTREFHNAQTLLMGSMPGACALYFLWGRGGEARVRFHAVTRHEVWSRPPPDAAGELRGNGEGQASHLGGGLELESVSLPPGLARKPVDRPRRFVPWMQASPVKRGPEPG